MNKVRMWVSFPENYDEDAIYALTEEKFPEATLMFGERFLNFIGTAERSQELLRAIETIGEHSSVRFQRLD